MLEESGLQSLEHALIFSLDWVPRSYLLRRRKQEKKHVMALYLIETPIEDKVPPGRRESSLFYNLSQSLNNLV